jgi:hypothetical protein
MSAVKAVIDCANAGLPDAELAAVVAARFEEAALEALRAADLQKAAQLLDEAKDIVAQSTVAKETFVPLTAAELEQRAADEAVALEDARARRRQEVEAELARTDKWAARAVEEGVAMPPERVAYRQTLRALFAEIDAADGLATLEKVALPSAPAA